MQPTNTQQTLQNNLNGSVNLPGQGHGTYSERYRFIIETFENKGEGANDIISIKDIVTVLQNNISVSEKYFLIRNILWWGNKEMKETLLSSIFTILSDVDIKWQSFLVKTIIRKGIQTLKVNILLQDIQSILNNKSLDSESNCDLVIAILEDGTTAMKAIQHIQYLLNQQDLMHPYGVSFAINTQPFFYTNIK